MTGFYLMHRGWMDNDVFKDVVYTEREAWLWLIENAQYEAGNTFINGKRVNLDRGQLSFSLRFLADKWGWSKSETERYTQKLRKRDMIETETETGQLVITICNYDEYQMKPEKSGTASGTETGQKRDANETGVRTKKKELNNKINNLTPVVPLPAWCPEEPWMRFEEHRKNIGKKLTPYAAQLALKELEKFWSRGHDPTKIIQQTILNGWTGLFEPKDTRNAKPTNADTAKSALDRAEAEILAAESFG